MTVASDNVKFWQDDLVGSEKHGEVVSGDGANEIEGDVLDGDGDDPLGVMFIFIFMPLDGGLTEPELLVPLHRKGKPALLLVALQKLFHRSQPVMYMSRHAWLRETAQGGAFG